MGLAAQARNQVQVLADVFPRQTREVHNGLTVDRGVRRVLFELGALRHQHVPAVAARVSTKDRGQDTENQLRQLRQFAGTQGWAISQEYVDQTVGKRGDREQFQKMFSDASRREFDVLCFWSLDRLSREGVVETLNHLTKSAAMTSWACRLSAVTALV
jgi:predicted site-specific integrase-resolvase